MTQNMLPPGYEDWRAIDSGASLPDTDFLSVGARLFRQTEEGGFGSGHVESVHQSYYVPPTEDTGERPVQERTAPYIESSAGNLDMLPVGSAVVQRDGTAWLKSGLGWWRNASYVSATSQTLMEDCPVTVLHVAPEVSE